MKTIDTKSYLDALCELADKGETVSTVVSGSSMTPFLSPNRDYVFLEVPKKPIKKGDIVLYTRKNGAYILHRVKKAKNNIYFLVGDRQTTLEGPVNTEQIRCVVTGIKRKNKILKPTSPLWLFYSKIWINLIFLRPAVFKFASILKNRKHR